MSESEQMDKERENRLHNVLDIISHQAKEVDFTSQSAFNCIIPNPIQVADGPEFIVASAEFLFDTYYNTMFKLYVCGSCRYMVRATPQITTFMANMYRRYNLEKVGRERKFQDFAESVWAALKHKLPYGSDLTVVTLDEFLMSSGITPKEQRSVLKYTLDVLGDVFPATSDAQTQVESMVVSKFCELLIEPYGLTDLETEIGLLPIVKLRKELERLS